jgi:hypothetical protein
LREKIQFFFGSKLKDSFPDPNFVFDVYVPPPYHRVWLMDINPWARRTDPLLFSWLEILEMRGQDDGVTRGNVDGVTDYPDLTDEEVDQRHLGGNQDGHYTGGSEDRDRDGISYPTLVPEFRLVERDDPEAYGFTTPQYSAHKLPRDVVNASLSGRSGLGEFLGQWQDVLDKKIQEDEDAGSDGD